MERKKVKFAYDAKKLGKEFVTEYWEDIAKIFEKRGLGKIVSDKK